MSLLLYLLELELQSVMKETVRGKVLFVLENFDYEISLF